MCVCACMRVFINIKLKFKYVFLTPGFTQGVGYTTDEPILAPFSLNGCLPHWLKPYWNWWPCVKGQGHSDVIPIFSSCSLPYFLFQLSYFQSKGNSVCRFDIPLVDLCLNFIKIEWMMTSFWHHLRFLSTIVHLWISFTSKIRFVLFHFKTSSSQWNAVCLFSIWRTKADNNFRYSLKNHPSAYNKIHYEYIYWMTQEC